MPATAVELVLPKTFVTVTSVVMPTTCWHACAYTSPGVMLSPEPPVETALATVCTVGASATASVGSCFDAPKPPATFVMPAPTSPPSSEQTSASAAIFPAPVFFGFSTVFLSRRRTGSGS